MDKREILKLNEHRIHKVNKSLGVYSAYKWLRKRQWADIGQRLTEHEFYSIIRKINNELAYNLSLGIDVKLPHRMGTIELRKVSACVNFKDGKLHNTLPIDWDRTLKLWCEDKESYKNRTLIKIEEKEIFKVHYNKAKASYTNKSFYQFNANRELKKTLKRNIKEGKVDAFLLNKPEYELE